MDEISDDQLEAYGKSLDHFSIELWADFLSCNTVSCDNALYHQQMDHLYGALVDSVNLASNNLVKTFQHREKHITGWNRYCKNLHDDARKKFLIWHRHGRIRVGETFEAMKTSRSTFKKALKFCGKN